MTTLNSHWLDEKEKGKVITCNLLSIILGDPGAVSRIDKMFAVKVFCKIESGDEPLGTYSYRTSSRGVWIACFWLARKIFFWPISEEKLPGDSCVFLHNVVFLIDRHSCLARSTGNVSRGKFQNKMLTTRKNYNLYHGYKKQTLSDEFLRRIFPRYRKSLLLIRYTMHDFHFPHLNLLTLSSIQRQADILDVNVRCTTSETFYRVKISVARATQLRRLIVGNAS